MENSKKDIVHLVNKLDLKLSTVENRIDEKIKSNTDLMREMALIVQKGFDSIDKHFRIIEQRLLILEEGHREVKLRLNEVAHSFEVKEINRRVNILESKVQKIETQR